MCTNVHKVGNVWVPTSLLLPANQQLCECFHPKVQSHHGASALTVTRTPDEVMGLGTSWGCNGKVDGWGFQNREESSVVVEREARRWAA